MVWQGILLFCAISLGGNVNAFHQRILNGYDANIQDYPYQVSLRLFNRHFCGGSIISERHILTAGHCLKNSMFPPYDVITVVTGTSYAQKKGNSHRVAKVTIHPKYWTDQNSAVNDVAVITLKDPIVFNEYQQKINLPKNNYKVGDTATVTGWGLVVQFPSITPNQLQMLETKVISQEECQKNLINPEKTKIYDTEVCTIVGKGASVCSGDSGGPLAVNGELVGIVSWADGDYCGSGHPDVFTNVYKFNDFIEAAMK